jgi:predicted cupin superfamily sugar epimerase
MRSADEWITRLKLIRYPTGGAFGETYRSAESVPAAGLPGRFGADRSLGTAIYFLMEGSQVSPLHRLKGDELWHFYTGSPVTLHILAPDGTYTHVHLGDDPERDQSFQALAPGGCWFGATLDDSAAPGAYALLGCTMAPGFDPADYELGQRQALLAQFPAHTDLILHLTQP